MIVGGQFIKGKESTTTPVKHYCRGSHNFRGKLLLTTPARFHRNVGGRTNCTYGASHQPRQIHLFTTMSGLKL